jgi:hypothetical protein
MVETVGKIYEDQQVHAKAMICSKEFGEPPQVLNENTMDFIEARHEDIIMDGLLGGELTEAKDYTCTAGFIKYENEEEEK